MKSEKMVFYNDNDADIIAWLERLCRAGLIAEGEIDGRSIRDIRGEDVAGYRRVHLFAGIGGWEYALQLAGWPDDLQVWTGSCPCQPFSVAGKGVGYRDMRHLWPEMRRLIAERIPATIFGEQVAGKAGLHWLAGVRADLEALGYAVGCADLCSAGFGAPNIRQRLYWGAIRVGNTESDQQRWDSISAMHREWKQVGRSGSNDGLADPQGSRRRVELSDDQRAAGGEIHTFTDSSEGGSGGMGIAHSNGRAPGITATASAGYRDSPVATGFWSEYQIIPCADGKNRRIPVEPAFFPLATRLPGHVALLRGIGNAINPIVAAGFIRVFMEVQNKK